MNTEEIHKKVIELLSQKPMSVRELANNIGVSLAELHLGDIEHSSVEYDDATGKWRKRK